MGIPLTGSSVASTYTGLLKNADNSTVGATLKAISDGSGNESALQISNVAVNTTNDFSVATNKLTVASASGNTAIAGTLGVTGASTLASVGVTGSATVGTTLGVTGATTLTGDLAANGNTTLGNAGTDTLILNSDNITAPNISTVTVDIASDKVLITDASDSSKVKVVTASSLGISASNAPQVKSTNLTTTATITPSSSGSGTEITGLTTTITPRSINSTVLVTVTICYGVALNYSGTSCFRLTRDSTELGTPSSSVIPKQKGISCPSFYEGANGEYQNSITITFLDYPATTSAVTYKINVHTSNASLSSDVYINRSAYDFPVHTVGRSMSTMILQEYFA
jgi:hypothetical protein